MTTPILAAVVNKKGLRAVVKRISDITASGGGNPDCDITLGVSTLTYTAAGSQTVSITAANSAMISYGVSDPTWLAVSGPGSGSGTATVVVTGRPLVDRTGTVSICGEAVTVTQKGQAPLGCSNLGLIHEWMADRGVYSDAGSTLATNGQTARQWNDQIGTLHFGQATSNARPTWNTMQKNLLPSLSFDGVNDTMVTSSISEAATYEFFFVWKLRTWTADKWLFGTGSNNFDLICAYDGVSPQGKIYSGGWHTTGVPSDLKPGAYSIVNMRASADGSVHVSVNNGSEQSVGTYDDITTAFLNIASQAGASNYSALDVAHIVMYNCELTTQERADGYTYLNGKWAIY